MFAPPATQTAKYSKHNVEKPEDLTTQLGISVAVCLRAQWMAWCGPKPLLASRQYTAACLRKISLKCRMLMRGTTLYDGAYTSRLRHVHRTRLAKALSLAKGAFAPKRPVFSRCWPQVQEHRRISRYRSDGGAYQPSSTQSLPLSH